MVSRPSMLMVVMMKKTMTMTLVMVMPDGDGDGGSICYFPGATLVWVNLYVRSFEKIDDVKV